MQICLAAPELARLEPGSRALLRLRAEDAVWLNLNRPLISDRRLRLILWSDIDTAEHVQRHAVDFASWIARIVQVPPAQISGLVVEAMRAALADAAPFAWRGPLLSEVVGALDADLELVEVSADMSSSEMIRALQTPGLPAVSGVRSSRELDQVKTAAAAAGVSGWVVVDPECAELGIPVLEARQADWDEAARTLASRGWERAALVAAWLDLLPSLIDRACERVGESISIQG